jgi:hypothetical protein
MRIGDVEAAMIEKVTLPYGYVTNPDYAISFAWDDENQKITLQWIAHKKLRYKRISKRVMSKMLRAGIKRGYKIQFHCLPRDGKWAWEGLPPFDSRAAGLLHFRIWRRKC